MAVWSQINYRIARDGNRFDAEYYQPNYVSLLSVLRKAQTIPLGERAFVTDGIHASPEVVDVGGVRYLSAKCVKDNDFALADTLYISNQQNAANRRTQLRSGDILITTVGTIGNAAVVQPDFLPANADRHLGIVRLNDDSGLDPYFVAAFLTSRYGRLQTMREATGNVQLNLFIEKMKALLIPDLPCQVAVAELARKAYDRRRECEGLVRQAESALDAALDLRRVDLTPRLFYEDTFVRATAAGRFDAEYYQPAKRDALKALAVTKGRPVGELFRSVRQLWQPEGQPSTSEVRNYNLTDALSPFLDDTTPTTPAAEIDSTKKLLKPGDLVVSRLRSYLKEIAVVLPSGDVPTVGSTEFIVLRPTKTSISPEALLVFLRSPYVQTILTWSQDGSNHPRFDEKALLAIPIPPTVEKLQDELCNKIKAATSARQESRRLLDTAKRVVEIAIEEGEAAALRFIAEKRG